MNSKRREVFKHIKYINKLKHSTKAIREAKIRALYDLYAKLGTKNRKIYVCACVLAKTKKI